MEHIIQSIMQMDPVWAIIAIAGVAFVENIFPPFPSDVVVVATGSEVSLALEAADMVRGKAVRIVSMPSRELFYAQTGECKDAMLPKGARIVVAEAGVAQGWQEIAARENIFSIERFGASGPAADVAKHLGFTAEKLAELIARKV